MSTSKGIGRKNQGTSRRGFIKTAAVAAGAAGALSACDSAATSRSTAESKGLRIQMAGYDFDRVAALIDGRVPIEGAEVSFEVPSVGEMNVHVFSGPQTREVTEIGLHPFMLAYANDGFRDYSLIPASRCARSGTRAFSSAPIAASKVPKICGARRLQRRVIHRAP